MSDVHRILQLAGLKSLNEDVATMSNADTRSDFKRKYMPGAPASQSNWEPEHKKYVPKRPASQSNWSREEEDECYMQEDDMGSSADVTVTLPRSCAEWLKDHLLDDTGPDSEEAHCAIDALEEALCDDGSCEDDVDVVGDDEAVDDDMGELD